MSVKEPAGGLAHAVNEVAALVAEARGDSRWCSGRMVGGEAAEKRALHSFLHPELLEMRLRPRELLRKGVWKGKARRCDGQMARGSARG